MFARTPLSAGSRYMVEPPRGQTPSEPMPRPRTRPGGRRHRRVAPQPQPRRESSPHREATTPPSRTVTWADTDLMMQAAELAQVRETLVTNFNEHNIPHIDDSLGSNLEKELELFTQTFPDGFDEMSQEAKYSVLIQNIQARFKYGGYNYGKDENSEGVVEYWSTPAETIADQGQAIDCEDFAFMAREYGESMRGEFGIGGRFEVHGGVLNGDGHHAVCVYHAADGNQYVLDGTQLVIPESDFSRVQTLGDYSTENGFEWYKDSNGRMVILETAEGGNGQREFLQGTRFPNHETDSKPAEVIAAEQAGLNKQHAIDGTKGYVGNESDGFSQFIDLFSKERSWLWDCSIAEFGGVVIGPLGILGDIANYRKEDEKVENAKFANAAIYHATKRGIAKAKGVIDTIRYGAFVSIAFGATALAAPLIALGATAIRCFIGAYESVSIAASKDKQHERRSRQITRAQKTISRCPSDARNMLKARMSYKLKKEALGGSLFWGFLKGAAYTATGILSVVVLGKVAIAGTILVANPLVFGIGLSLFGTVALMQTMETCYRGFLLRKQNRKMLGKTDTLIGQRIKYIRSSHTGFFSKIASSLNVVGWVCDFCDDRTKKLPVPIRLLLALPILPLHIIAWMLEGKIIDKDQLFARMKEQFVRDNITSAQRAALLQTISKYYKMTHVDVLTLWASKSDLRDLRHLAKGRHMTRRPTLANELAKAWATQQYRVNSSDFNHNDYQEILELKEELGDKLQPF